ncbi:MAG: AsmA family protein [Acidiferrobacterales bacterium]
MKKAIKIFLYTIGFLVLLLVAAAVAATLFINPNDYKDDIVKVVHEKTGRELQLKGDIQLSLFPWLGLQLGQTSLGNAPGFGAKPMASIDKVDVKLKLLPLLRKQVEVDTVVLDGLELNLARNKRGTSNWDDLLTRTAPREKKPAEAKPAPAAAAPLAALTIGGIDIRNAQLHWVDAQSGTSANVRNLSLQTSKLAPATPMDVKLGFDLETGKPVIRTPVHLQGQVTVDPDKETLAIKGLQLSLLDLNVDANVNGKQILSAPVFSGKLTLRPTDVRSVLGKLGISVDMPADALKSVSLKSDVRFNQKTKTASADNLVLKLDDSKLTGNASYVMSAVPAIRADIAVDSIDVDRYLPPVSERKKEKEKEKGRKPRIAIPVEPLRTLNLRGSFKLGSLKAFGIRSSNISIPVVAKSGLVQVGPSKAQLYGGSYSGKQTLDVRKGSPKISSSEKLSNVEVGGLLKDADIFDKFSGTGNVQANITTRGLDVDDILNSLNGTASASLKNGALSGINILDTINNKCRELQQPGAAPIQQDSKNKSTPFADFSASTQIKNGIVSNKDLLARGKLLKITGKGTINLPKKNMDYLAQVNLLGETTCWTTQFAVVAKGRFSELGITKIIGDTLAYEYKKQLEKKAKKAVEEEIKKRLGIQPKKTTPTTPEQQTEPAKKTPEEQLKEELRKRLGL